MKTDEGEYILVESLGVRYPPGVTSMFVTHTIQSILTDAFYLDTAEKGEAAKKLADKHHVSEYTFQVKLTLETGSPRLAYLNKSIIVGSAKRTDTNVSYDAYIVEQHVKSKL